jgi:hypothetical protein
MGQNSETTSAYFRRILTENPKLLKKGGNPEIFERWLKDHPAEKEVPKNVQAIFHNLKSVIRKKRRQRRAEQAQSPAPDQPDAAAVALKVPVALKASTAALEALQDQIDDCLSVARSMDREGLAEVIQLLRSARNRVVQQAGV